jgi:hypothetical protein
VKWYSENMNWVILLEELGPDRGIVLKLILKKCGVMVYSVFVWLIIGAPYSTGSVFSSPPTEELFWVISCFPPVRSQLTSVLCLAPVQDRFHPHFLYLERFTFPFLPRCSLWPFTGSAYKGLDVKNWVDCSGCTLTFILYVYVKL